VFESSPIAFAFRRQLQKPQNRMFLSICARRNSGAGLIISLVAKLQQACSIAEYAWDSFNLASPGCGLRLVLRQSMRRRVYGG
jgi:hypothetical protein